MKYRCLMYPNKKSRFDKYDYRLPNRNRSNGSSLVIAIFVIIVMSLLGAALVKMMESSQENVAFEVLGTRAYTAARTGIQWQLAQLFPVGLNSEPVKTCDNASNNPPDISNIPGLQGCNIVSPIQCEDFLHDEGGRYYTITSVGQCNIDGEFTSRVIKVEARSM